MTVIISLISQKGGVGKSTIARALAVELVKANYSVKIADMDTKQTTCIEWNVWREENGIEPYITAVLPCKTPKRAISDSDKYDIVIIDCPPYASKDTLEIAKVSDIVIHPVGATRDDCRPAVKLFHELTGKNIDSSKLFICFSRVGSTAQANRWRNYINEAGYTSIDAEILNETSYGDAMSDGFSILENKYKSLSKRAGIVVQCIFDKLTND